MCVSFFKALVNIKNKNVLVFTGVYPVNDVVIVSGEL